MLPIDGLQPDSFYFIVDAATACICLLNESKMVPWFISEQIQFDI